MKIHFCSLSAIILKVEAKAASTTIILSGLWQRTKALPIKCSLIEAFRLVGCQGQTPWETVGVERPESQDFSHVNVCLSHLAVVWLQIQ